MKYEYFINLDERGEFYSDVRCASSTRTVAEFFTEDAIEWSEDGYNIRDAQTVLMNLIERGVVRKCATISKGN